MWYGRFNIERTSSVYKEWAKRISVILYTCSILPKKRDPRFLMSTCMYIRNPIPCWSLMRGHLFFFSIFFSYYEHYIFALNNICEIVIVSNCNRMIWTRAILSIQRPPRVQSSVLFAVRCGSSSIIHTNSSDNNNYDINNNDNKSNNNINHN